MKSITKLAIGAAVVLLVAAGLQPAQAACPAGEPRIVEFAGAYIVSNPAWCGPGGTGVGFGCYESEGGPPVSDNIDGFFWAETSANEGILAGDDNGDWPVDRWVKQFSVPAGGEIYHYPAFLSFNDDQYYYQPGTAANWASSDLIDGCISNVTPTVSFDECHCALITDEFGGVGYFGIFSEISDAGGNFIFTNTPGQVYNLAPIPRPEVTGSTRDTATATVTFNINVPTPTGGDFRDPACDCNFGFRVYAAVVGEGGMVPSSRAACTQRALVAAGGPSLSYNDPGFAAACQAAGFAWIPASNVAGGSQPVTVFGGGRATAGVSVDCGDPLMAYDLYLATALGANEGAGVQVQGVSQNSFQVKCGNYTLAEPSRPERQAAPGRTGESPRGRDKSRER